MKTILFFVGLFVVAGCGGDSSFCQAYVDQCPQAKSFTQAEVAQCQDLCEEQGNMEMEGCWFLYCAVETGLCDNEESGDESIVNCGVAHGWYSGESTNGIPVDLAE
jgi:hypothetical protein